MAQQKISQEDVNTYNLLKQQYQSIYKVQSDLEEERKDHKLVLDALKDLNAERRAFRLIGGSLVESTVGEVRPELNNNLSMIDKVIETQQRNLTQKEKELIEFELKFIF